MAMNVRPMIPLALAAALALPLVAHADPLSVFQPVRVRPISVTQADFRALRALPPLEAFGTVRGTRVPGVDEVGSASEAAQEAGYEVRLPSGIPASLGKDVRYQVTQRAQTSFTFDRAKAAAWARDHQVTLAPVPPALNGATFTATLDPITMVTYGPQRVAQKSTRTPRGGPRRAQFLTVVQAPLPTVTTSGTTLQTLVDWFASQPGIPPHLIAQIKAIGDPTQTLPIPIRFDQQTAAKVTVDGVQGLAIGDETGIGSAVVWTRDGKLYAVGGTLTQTQALALADRLK
jgi:hypothetical protein